MSHVVVLDLDIKNLDAVKKLCKNLGWSFLENQKTYVWYGRWMNDYSQQDAAVNQGIKPEDLGKCDHAISIPGCHYQLGLKSVGDKYTLLWDWWDKDLKKAMGGEKGQVFMQEYGLACIQQEADQFGYSYTTKKLDNGFYEIEVETY